MQVSIAKGNGQIALDICTLRTSIYLCNMPHMYIMTNFANITYSHHWTMFILLLDPPPSDVKRIIDTFFPIPILVLALTDTSIGFSGTKGNF